jgi:hypothetical protein
VGGDKTFTKIALVVIGSLFWSVGVGAVLALNKRPPFSPWHATVLVPLAVGLVLVLS